MAAQRHMHGNAVHGHAGGGARHTHAAGARAERPLPQTVGGSMNDGSFVAHSRKSARPGYSVASSFGATIDQPLSAAPGYLRFLDLTLSGSGGSGATGTAGTGDSVFSEAAAISFMQVKDSFGTVVWSGGGLELGYLTQLYSGQVGALGANDPKKWPSYSAISAVANGAGDFAYRFRIPFEFAHGGLGCLSMGNAALQPSLHIQFSTAAAFYNTVPVNVTPALNLTVDEAYWAVPNGEYQDLEPPMLGTTCQWIQLTANPTVGSGSSQRIQFPRVAGQITEIILLARNSLGAVRDDVWPSALSNIDNASAVTAAAPNNRIRLYLDGVPVLDESMDERWDKSFINQGGFFGSRNLTAFTNRVKGSVYYDFQDTPSQFNSGLGSNLDGTLSTNPGTLIEVECTPWGTFSNGPAVITAIVGAIVPRGASPA